MVEHEGRGWVSEGWGGQLELLEFPEFQSQIKAASQTSDVDVRGTNVRLLPEIFIYEKILI